VSTVRKRAAENSEQIFVSLVLGAGFIALFAGFNFFWMIWVFGFAVLLPLIGSLTGEGDEDETDIERDSHQPTEHSDDATTDALATLRNRYARGELTDDQFERKLDALLETEHPESAAEWRSREREPVEERS
jgi:uncharacterized membrane protein